MACRRTGAAPAGGGMAGLMRRWAWALLLLPVLAGAQPATVNAQAFSQPLGGEAGWADTADREAFLRGRSLFRRAWIVGPSTDSEGRGLGPLFNRLSCVACHPNNGRGQAPSGPAQRMQSMLVRLSLPGRDAHGGPRPHPAYGDQLNEEGVAGVPGEGRAQMQWKEARTLTLPGGERVSLRQPRLRLTELAYGPLGRALTSARVGPSVFGLGLLAAVPDDEILAWARQSQPDGVHGRPNRVWDPVRQRMMLGRLGWKANTGSLAAQVVQAAHGDLGLTSPALPQPACAPRQAACRARAAHEAAAMGGEGLLPELSTAAAADLTHYLQRLAPPAPRNVGEPTVERGRALFTSLGCVACHRPALQTTALPFAPFSPQTVSAYTDLLLHDMGAGLADGRPDYAATGRQWRTAPLWGLGLVPVVNEHSQYLHDGRARTLQEAVLWHGGEARRARERYAALTRPDRAAVLAFLASL